MSCWSQQRDQKPNRAVAVTCTHLTSPALCFCSGSFLSGALGASLQQQQAGPELIAATCSISSAAPHSLVTAAALKLCPWCQPPPRLQHFAAVDDPASQLLLPERLFPVGYANWSPAACTGLCLFSPKDSFPPGLSSPRQLSTAKLENPLV